MGILWSIPNHLATKRQLLLVKYTANQLCTPGTCQVVSKFNYGQTLANLSWKLSGNCPKLLALVPKLEIQRPCSGILKLNIIFIQEKILVNVSGYSIIEILALEFSSSASSYRCVYSSFYLPSSFYVMDQAYHRYVRPSKGYIMQYFRNFIVEQKLP